MNSAQQAIEPSAAVRATESTAPSAAASTEPPGAGSPIAERDPLAAIMQELSGVARSLQDSASATIDSARVAVRNAVMRLFIAIASAACVVLLICVGWVLALIGAAGMLSALFDLPPWFGNTVVGILGVVVPALVVRSKIVGMRSAALSALRAKYTPEARRENA